MTLSLDCMMNGAAPSAMHGRTTAFLTRRFSRRMRMVDFFEHRNDTTQTQLTPWERIVASAAPRTPRFSTKMNSGSSRILSAAPMSTVSMPVLAKPCAVM